MKKVAVCKVATTPPSTNKNSKMLEGFSIEDHSIIEIPKITKKTILSTTNINKLLLQKNISSNSTNNHDRVRLQKRYSKETQKLKMNKNYTTSIETETNCNSKYPIYNKTMESDIIKVRIDTPNLMNVVTCVEDYNYKDDKYKELMNKFLRKNEGSKTTINIRSNNNYDKKKWFRPISTLCNKISKMDKNKLQFCIQDNSKKYGDVLKYPSMTKNKRDNIQYKNKIIMENKKYFNEPFRLINKTNFNEKYRIIEDNPGYLEKNKNFKSHKKMHKPNLMVRTKEIIDCYEKAKKREENKNYKNNNSYLRKIKFRKKIIKAIKKCAIEKLGVKISFEDYYKYFIKYTNLSDQITNSKYNQLLFAIKNEDIETAKIYINDDPSLLFLLDSYKKTPLIWAVQKNLCELIPLMISYGANVNAQDFIGRTALHFAILNDRIDTSLELLDNMADPFLKDHNGKTPINYNEDKVIYKNPNKNILNVILNKIGAAHIFNLFYRRWKEYRNAIQKEVGEFKKTDL